MGSNVADDGATDAKYQALPDSAYDGLNIKDVRRKLERNGEMAVAHLCYEASKHASFAMTHSDEQMRAIFEKLAGQDIGDLKQTITKLMDELSDWRKENPVKSTLMILGLGGTIFKSKSIALLLISTSQSFISWGQSASTGMRFLGFVVLMMIRLVVSTLVPPTSPAFGIILQAATPTSEKATAMPFFLLASTVAGAMPYILDKVLQVFTGKDFRFSMGMQKFTEAWPLTCWTFPAMTKVFESTGGDKLGASVAVIVAHAAPFMGAQTTMMQRYFLPHPLDSIISQPFGMLEDLVSMALAEATSNPTTGSISLTVLLVAFNMAQFAIFQTSVESIPDGIVCTFRDFRAFITAILNATLGLFVWQQILPEVTGIMAFIVVACQLAFQVLVVPFMLNLNLWKRAQTPKLAAPIVASAPNHEASARTHEAGINSDDQRVLKRLVVSLQADLQKAEENRLQATDMLNDTIKMQMQMMKQMHQQADRMEVNQKNQSWC